MSTPNGVMAGAPAPAIEARQRPSGTLWPTLRAIYIIWYRDILRFWRDRTRLAASFAQPLLYLLIFGTGLSSALSGAGGFGGAGAQAGFSYTQFIFPGIMGMSVLFSSMFAAVSIVWDREFGFLKEVLVAPIDRSAVAIGKALGGATQAMLQGLILLLLAPFVGVKLTVMSVVTIIPLVFVLAFALSAMGVAIASRMRSMQGFQMVMNFLVMPMFFLSGALFPLSGLPGWMTVLTRIDPAAYGIDPLRRVLLEGAGMPSQALDRLSLTIGGSPVPIIAEVGIMLAFGFVVLAIAVRNFRVRD
jgi:ABC-2 type transport system permease protein